MSKEVHLYTAGNDPFVLPVGDVTFYIHRGLPTAAPAAPENPPGGAVVILKPSKLPPVIGAFVASPETSGEFRELLDAQGEGPIELGVALPVFEREIDSHALIAVFDGIEAATAEDVTVHLVAEQGEEFDG